MLKFLLVVLALIAAYIFVQAYPDIQRYLRIRAM
ncbi:MAG: DUF6893 family small protein [Ktedonobacteraceae bacterium]